MIVFKKEENFKENDIYIGTLKGYLKKFADSHIPLLFEHDIAKVVPRLIGYRHRFYWNNDMNTYELFILTEWGRVRATCDTLKNVKRTAKSKELDSKDFWLHEFEKEGVWAFSVGGKETILW